MQFTARTCTGAGRGTEIGFPTINLVLNDVPKTVEPGLFACLATIDAISYQAVMHYGIRPTVGDEKSCEVHLLDTTLFTLPEAVTVHMVQRLRGIQNFGSVEGLKTQIATDIVQARGILSTYAQRA